MKQRQLLRRGVVASVGMIIRFVCCLNTEQILPRSIASALRGVAVCLLGTIAIALPSLGDWRTVGPYGGSANIVNVARSEPEVVVSATRNGQIYLSTDAGSSWNRCAFPVEHSVILHALAIDPKNAGRWFAGVEADMGRLSGIYRTTDSGQTWTFLPGIAGKAIWSLAIWDSDPNWMVAGAADGVYRSTDGGEIWNRISPESNQDLRPVVSLAIDPVDSNVILAGTTHLPYRTADGGTTWQSMHAGMLDDSDVFSIVIHPENRRILYSSACSGAYRSADGGALWSRMPTPRGAFRTYVVAVDPLSPKVVYSGTSAGLMQSDDEGRTWRKISPHDVRSIAFDRLHAGRVYFASEAGGILKSTDGGKTIRESNHGFSNRNWVAFAAAGKRLYAISTYFSQGGIFRSDDLGVSWARISGSEATGGEDIRLIAVDADAPDSIYAATRSRIWRSKDGGKAWSAFGSGLGSETVLALGIEKTTPRRILAVTTGAVFRSAEAGGWERRPIPAGTKPASAHLSGSTIALAGTAGLALTVDAGQTWTTCAPPRPQLTWYDLMVQAPDRLLAATSSGMFRSAEGCGGWSLIRDGIEPSTVFRIGTNPLGSDLFAVQHAGVLRSADEGKKWSPLAGSSHDQSTPIQLIMLQDHPEILYGLFSRRGVAEWPLSSNGATAIE